MNNRDLTNLTDITYHIIIMLFYLTFHYTNDIKLNYYI